MWLIIVWLRIISFVHDFPHLVHEEHRVLDNLALITLILLIW